MSPLGGVAYPVESRLLQRAMCLVHSSACSEGLLLAARDSAIPTRWKDSHNIGCSSTVVVVSDTPSTHEIASSSTEDLHFRSSTVFRVAKAICSYGYAKRMLQHRTEASTTECTLLPIRLLHTQGTAGRYVIGDWSVAA